MKIIYIMGVFLYGGFFVFILTKFIREWRKK